MKYKPRVKLLAFVLALLLVLPPILPSFAQAEQIAPETEDVHTQIESLEVTTTQVADKLVNFKFIFIVEMVWDEM